MRGIALLALLVAPSHALGTTCTGMPRWLGINQNGALEYCDKTGTVRTLAFSDSMGAALSVAGPTSRIIMYEDACPAGWHGIEVQSGIKVGKPPRDVTYCQKDAQ